MFYVADFEAQAQKILKKDVFDYISSGANEELTLRDNTKAFARYRLRPRVLRDVSDVDMSTSLLGDEVTCPIAVAPTSGHKFAHPDGELGTAKGAARMGTCMVLSTWSQYSIEEVAQASPTSLKWFQLYIFTDRELSRNMVQRAEKAGYKALVVTVDHAAFGKCHARKDFHYKVPFSMFWSNFKNTSVESMLNESEPFIDTKVLFPLFESGLTWEDIDWLRGITELPIILKGILTAEDAEEALKHDIQGIIVSNHGGRQLDGALATIDALGEVVQAVQGRVEVYLDGGIRQGTDVLKALALGARAIFVGRPIVWGLACKGDEGVAEVITLLRDELKTAMMLTGCRKISEITSSLIKHQPYGVE